MFFLFFFNFFFIIYYLCIYLFKSQDTIIKFILFLDRIYQLIVIFCCYIKFKLHLSSVSLLAYHISV